MLLENAVKFWKCEIETDGNIDPAINCVCGTAKPIFKRGFQFTYFLSVKAAAEFRNFMLEAAFKICFVNFLSILVTSLQSKFSHTTIRSKP